MSRIDELEKELKAEKAKEMYIEFCSPGTLVSETTKVKTDHNVPNIREAIRKYKNIKERHDAKPYGFRYVDGNGKPISELFYYINGTISTYNDIPDNEKNNILRSNMRCDNQPIIIENNNSWRFTAFFHQTYIIIDEDCNIIRSGDDKDLMEYRKNFSKTNK